MALFRSRAEVAELADALDSGSSARKGMGVQVPPSAPALPLPSYVDSPPGDFRIFFTSFPDPPHFSLEYISQWL